MADLISSKINLPFTFSPRPEPLLADLRLTWRIAVLLILLHFSRGKRASLKKLHVIDWAIRSPASRTRFLAYVRGLGNPEDIIVRFDPSLNRTIDYARGADLVAIDRGRNLKLTDRGSSVAQQLVEIDECFVSELEFLNRAKQYILEKNIDSLLSWENIL